MYIEAQTFESDGDALLRLDIIALYDCVPKFALHLEYLRILGDELR